jgi:hypothetical protein
VRVVVDLGASPPAVSLADPADCGRFHVELHGQGDDAALDAALRASDIGSSAAPGEAEVRVDAVRRMAVGSVGDSWEKDFDAMLSYAGSKGWLSADGTTIRAHVERG